MIISSNIKYLRKKYNLTQSDLAEKMNTKKSTISNWENETNGITFENALKLCEIFKIDIDDFGKKDLSVIYDTNISEAIADIIRLNSMQDRYNYNLLTMSYSEFTELQNDLQNVVTAVFEKRKKENK